MHLRQHRVGYIALLAVGTAAVMAIASQRTGNIKAQNTRSSPLPESRLQNAEPRITGTATAVDGDTIDVGKVRIRIHAIDAPEAAQTCESQLSSYKCGESSKSALADLLRERPVTCNPISRDKWGRIVARCSVETRDIGAWMVENGWAIAFRRYSTEYVGLEETARINKLGLWRGSFQLPAEWRRK